MIFKKGVKKMIFANDLKKGTEIKLKSGWSAIIKDNKKGLIRMALVFGNYEELGSIYIFDIDQALVGGEWCNVALTEAQAKQAEKIINQLE